jgi:cell division transport system permease protein
LDLNAIQGFAKPIKGYKLLRRIKVRPNYLIPFTSTTIVMLILGILGTAYLFSGEMVRWLKESTDIAVEIGKDYSSEEAEEVIELLREDEKIIGESVRHLPPEEALEVMGLDLTSASWWEDGENPFSHMVVFNVHHQWFEPADLSILRRQIKENIPYVEEVHYQDRLVLDFHSNLERLAWWFAGFGMLFLLLSVVLIYNTTKLALYSDRREIETMELVGASRGFIRKPYLIKSFLLGLLSGIIALSLIFGIVHFGYGDVIELLKDTQSQQLLIVLGSLPIMSGLFCLICTWFTLNQFLKYR